MDPHFVQTILALWHPAANFWFLAGGEVATFRFGPSSMWLNSRKAAARATKWVKRFIWLTSSTRRLQRSKKNSWSGRPEHVFFRPKLFWVLDSGMSFPKISGPKKSHQKKTPFLHPWPFKKLEENPQASGKLLLSNCHDLFDPEDLALASCQLGDYVITPDGGLGWNRGLDKVPLGQVDKASVKSWDFWRETNATW